MEERYQEILKTVISKPYRLPSRLSELIIGECRFERMEPKQMISKGGEKDTSEYFLLDGIIHRYVLTEEGEFITTDFYVGPTIIMPHFARTSNDQSLFSLQALTSATVAIIPVKILDNLKETHQEIREWGQKIIENKLKRNFVEEVQFRSKNAKERLAHLRDEFPNIENKIPHSCIASYVGITPVSFSRLRKELTHNS